jgi:hypothetical protein
MKTYISDIIPSIQRFSQRLDDTTKLTNQHWISLDDISTIKRVFIFRANNQFIISDNGIVEKGSWEYIDNQTLVIDTKNESYLMKHGFLDDTILALRLDGSNGYAFFVNQNKSQRELNTIDDINVFLKNRYSGNGIPEGKKTAPLSFGYTILKEKVAWDLFWGDIISYTIKFYNGKIGYVYKGSKTGKYFFVGYSTKKQYRDSFEQAVYDLFLAITI